MASFDSSSPEVCMVFRTAVKQYQEGVVHHKYSMTYRLLVLLQGGFLLRIGDREESCEPGDIIFMPPQVEYHTVFGGGDSVFLNIFFDFFPGGDVNPPELPMRNYFVMLGNEPLDTDKVRERLVFDDVPKFNETLVIRGMPDAVNKCSELYRLYKNGGTHARLRKNARLAELLADISDYVSVRRRNASSITAHTIVGYIDEHYNEHLTCRSVAEHFAYHPNYVNRIVRELTGYSLHEYIILVKIQHANQLLLETDMSITDIAYYLGFHDSSHFSAVYQTHTGMKPSWRRRMIADMPD